MGKVSPGTENDCTGRSIIPEDDPSLLGHQVTVGAEAAQGAGQVADDSGDSFCSPYHTDSDTLRRVDPTLVSRRLEESMEIEENVCDSQILLNDNSDASGVIETGLATANEQLANLGEALMLYIISRNGSQQQNSKRIGQSAVLRSV